MKTKRVVRTHVRYYLGQHSLGEVGLRHVGVWGEDVVDIAPVLGPQVACQQRSHKQWLCCWCLFPGLLVFYFGQLYTSTSLRSFLYQISVHLFI